MRNLFVSLIVLSFCAAAGAQTRPSSRASAATQPADEDHLSVTTHQITLHGNPLRYETTAGTIGIKDDAGKPRATFFFMAYRLLTDPETDVPKRPITFVFNGGPGSASVWLHLGTVGPMRVNNSPEGDPGPPPHSLVENQETWLDATDLVFIGRTKGDANHYLTLLCILRRLRQPVGRPEGCAPGQEPPRSFGSIGYSRTGGSAPYVPSPIFPPPASGAY